MLPKPLIECLKYLNFHCLHNFRTHSKCSPDTKGTIVPVSSTYNDLEEVSRDKPQRSFTYTSYVTLFYTTFSCGHVMAIKKHPNRFSMFTDLACLSY